MTRLDVNTPKGQETLEQERDAVAIFKRHYPTWEYDHTAKDTAARFDAHLLEDGTRRAIAEMKCRNMSLDEFRGRYKSEWLLTLGKIMACKSVAQRFQVAFVGMLYLVPSKTLLAKTLWTPGKGWAVPYRVARTETQATVNGGKATRDNAYLDMSTATNLS